MTARSRARRGEDNVVPLLTTTPTFILLSEVYSAARGSPPHPKPFSPPLPPTPATLRRAGVTCARPSRLPSARSKLLRACRGTTPAQPTLWQREPTGLPAHRSNEPRHARRTRVPGLERGSGGREGKAAPGRPAPSHSRPARRPPSLRIPTPARSRPRALLSRKHNPHNPSPGPRTPSILVVWRLRRRRRAAPPPLLSPSSRAPTRTCAPHAAAANLRGAPSCPRGGQAQEEGEGAARGSMRAGNAVPRGPPVRRETERGDQWGWGPKPILTGSTVAILDRSDRTTAPEGGVRGKKGDSNRIGRLLFTWRTCPFGPGGACARLRLRV